MTAGRLYGVGVGPGDPELVTVKAQRLIAAAGVVAYPCARHGRSVARRAAQPWLEDGVHEEPLTYPVTTEAVASQDEYEALIRGFYDASAAKLAAHLQAGRDVVVLCEGDPFFYGSYMYLHERLAHRFATQVVPGVTAFSAAAAAAGTPLAKRDDVFTVLPGTLGERALAAGLRGADAAVVMKLGRTFDDARSAARRAGVADRAVYVERASSDEQRIVPLDDVEGAVPYMSLVLVPTTNAPGTTPDERRAPAGRVSVIGLGPGGPEWLTPEARAELAEADELVGYDTYLRRVTPRPGQRVHATDNRVEAERAAFALDLAARGAKVAVVSSGDPGIFAMAAAVLEVAGDDERAIEIRVVPGLSAMQAAAARAGAPLGHDFCVISLSDQLKPWEIVERRLHAAASADLALALYNPASRTRSEQLVRAREVLLEHRDAATPVVVARAVGSDEETVTITTLAELDCDTVDMRTLLLVGSSQTRVLPGPDGRPRVLTPRSYPPVAAPSRA